MRNGKYWIGQIHLWLGLVSGLVVFIVCVTGCLFAFQEEISNVVYRHTFFIPAEAPVQRNSRVPLPLSRLLDTAQTALGAAQPVNYITTYAVRDRTWEFMAYKSNDTALTYFGSLTYFRSVFVDPYTGKVTGFRDYKHDFFNIVKYLHWSLLLNTAYGQPIVGWSTLIFVVLLVTGLVLWWPKRWRKADRRRSLTIMWKARFKRLNYDLHNVLGFYSLLLALVLALTGMVFSFSWFSRAVYVAAAGTTAPSPAREVKSRPTTAAPTPNPLDIAYTDALRRLPDAKRIGVSPAKGPAATINIDGYKGKETYYNRDELAFDRYSGRLLQRRDEAKKNRGDRLIDMNYDIHVGAIGGLTGKVITFLISLICASLPVTGFLVWWKK